MHGYATIWLRGPHYPLVEGFQAILADGTDFRGAEFETFREIAARYPQTKRIALMDFPRIEDRRRLEAGARRVVEAAQRGRFAAELKHFNISIILRFRAKA